MSNQLLTQSKIVQSQLRNDLPDFKAGSVVQIHYKIIEESKERVQIFAGLVISRHGGKGLDATFTVLKNATAGIKVHRTFPLHSPLITKIEIISPIQRGLRSKLYFAAKLKDPIKSVRVKAVQALKSKVSQPEVKEQSHKKPTTNSKKIISKTPTKKSSKTSKSNKPSI
ncbi:50S ribosomal protein L19 [Candidatus Gracilibacteria bacterium]|nr:50S ribosomal protein L19 [Candidatus Gracilibacteria bacterium]